MTNETFVINSSDSEFDSKLITFLTDTVVKKDTVKLSLVTMTDPLQDIEDIRYFTTELQRLTLKPAAANRLKALKFRHGIE